MDFGSKSSLYSFDTAFAASAPLICCVSEISGIFAAKGYTMIGIMDPLKLSASFLRLGGYLFESNLKVAQICAAWQTDLFLGRFEYTEPSKTEPVPFLTKRQSNSKKPAGKPKSSTKHTVAAIVKPKETKPKPATKAASAKKTKAETKPEPVAKKPKPVVAKAKTAKKDLQAASEANFVAKPTKVVAKANVKASEQKKPAETAEIKPLPGKSVAAKTGKTAKAPVNGTKPKRARQPSMPPEISERASKKARQKPAPKNS
ncbi:MAG: hypothetical protein AAFU69_04170 [Pseudomonadota bacterium]